jgi:hypothetical protein
VRQHSLRLRIWSPTPRTMAEQVYSDAAARRIGTPPRLPVDQED